MCAAKRIQAIPRQIYLGSYCHIYTLLLVIYVCLAHLQHINTIVQSLVQASVCNNLPYRYTVSQRLQPIASQTW